MSRLYYLAVFIPVAIVLDLAGASAVPVFFTAALGIVPTAVLMSDATEHLAARAGPGIGGLLNVTFGNAPELIIAAFALQKGLHEVVKASLVGSVIGNSLLVMGFAMTVGGWKRKRQHFSREATDRVSKLLVIAAAALIVPTIVLVVTGHGHLPGVNEPRHDYAGLIEILSLIVGLGLLARYSIGLTVAVRGRKGLFDVEAGDPPEDTWTTRRSVTLLAVAGVAVGGMSEVLVGSIEEASHSIGLSQFFVGVFVVGIAGNAAEHWVAVVVAAKDKMDLSLSIALGSSVQIAMFLVPALVFLSFLLGPHPMALVFNGYEIAGLVCAAVIARFVTRGGQSTRNEGMLLVAVYVGLGVLFALA